MLAASWSASWGKLDSAGDMGQAIFQELTMIVQGLGQLLGINLTWDDLFLRRWL